MQREISSFENDRSGGGGAFCTKEADQRKFMMGRERKRDNTFLAENQILLEPPLSTSNAI